MLKKEKKKKKKPAFNSQVKEKDLVKKAKRVSFYLVKWISRPN